MLLNSFLANQTNTTSEEKTDSINKYFYTNENISKSKKIESEQRRRNYVYQNLDYFLSAITYFDFFSLDNFKIFNGSKNIAKSYNVEFVTIEILLISFIFSETQLSNLLLEYGINKESISKNFPYFIKKNDLSKTVLFENFKKYTNGLKTDPKFSHEINLLIEKAANNALKRFKTPIITSEILFLTLIEQKNNKSIKILKKIINNDLNWQLLRYKIIKRIHKEESLIRDEISKNQYYFAYLLKTQLTDIEFDRLITNELLNTGVELFRNTLISKLLQSNISEIIIKDIHKSINLNYKRIYSA